MQCIGPLSFATGPGFFLACYELLKGVVEQLNIGTEYKRESAGSFFPAFLLTHYLSKLHIIIWRGIIDHIIGLTDVT